jgi:TRAP-type uncharacterized transport system substrate-binding protein
MKNNPQRSLIGELRVRRNDVFRAIGPGALVTAIGFGIAFYFVEPPPPDVVVIATGKSDGGYYSAAKQYAEVFARNGVNLKIRATAGSGENYQLLLEDNDVQLAIVQGGTAPKDSQKTRGLEAIATLYLEPVWVFHRLKQSLTELRQLKGKRIAVGDDGSGTQMLSTELLRDNGVKGGHEGTNFINRGGRSAVELLQAGEVDAVFLILAPDSPIIVELLQAEKIHLMSFERQLAYSRRYPFLKSVVLEQGVLDFDRNLPNRSVKLISPVANLVAREEIHDAFIPLLLEAATARHVSGGLLASAGEFPSLKHTEFPPSEATRHYMSSGPSFFQQHLSFWVASLIDRTKIMLVPLLVLLIPLIKIAPPVYRWRIRSRIYRWYGILREIDQQLRHGELDEIVSHAETLNQMKSELERVNVPLSYMQEFYHLRLHLDLVQQGLDERSRDQAVKQAQA